MLCYFLLYILVSQLCTYILSLWSLPPPPSHPSRSSQSTELSSLWYTAASHYLYMAAYVATLCLSLSLLPLLCPKVHSLWLHLYSFLADRFISTTFLDSIDIIFHPIDITLIYDIYFSHSDMLHPVWQTLGPSASLQMSEFYSFLLQSDIPLYRRIPFKLGDFDKVYCPL